MKKPIISVIGRPNVGKSTLINRLASKRVCIVGEQAGLTRDRNYIDVEWDDIALTVVDTGGIVFGETNSETGETDYIAQEIYAQALKGIEESDAVVLMMDATSGITKLDDEIAKLLRENISIPVYVAVNKVDSPEREPLIYDFYKLGFKNVFPISALHGSHGLNDLIDGLLEEIGASQGQEEEEERKEIRISFVGKPNVGKSSLFNKLVGTERAIVSEVSGTTRDSINMKLKRHGEVFELVDTAGLRRKSKIKEEVERFSTLRTINAIERSDVVVLLVDATEEEIVSDQEQRIASLVAERGKACIVLVNKWDEFPDKDNQLKVEEYRSQLDYKLRFISYAPREFISALTGQRTDNVWKLALAVNEQHKRRVETNVLNKVISDISIFHSPPVIKQKALKIKYASQVAVAPPHFVFFVNYPDLVPEAYKRFLEDQIRQYFGFDGTPIFIKFKSSNTKNDRL